MANTNIIFKGNGNFSEEQKIQMAAIFGISVEELNKRMTVQTVKEKLGKLEGQLNEAGIYICPVCGRETNYNELNEEAQAKARKSGICPNCQRAVDYIGANKIRVSSGTKTKNAVSAAEAVKSAIVPHLDDLTEEMLQQFTDAQFCKKELKTAYPLFVRLPENCTKEQKNAMRKPDGKNARFGAVEYSFLGAKWLLCNDFYYNKNVDVLVKYFEKLFSADEVANEEAVEENA